MDASTVAEIANQLGIAANNVGELVNTLLPQFIAYEGFGCLQQGLVIEFFLMILAGGISFAYYSSEYDYWDIDQKAAFKRGIILILAVLTLLIAVFELIQFCQVAAAPQMAIVNYILRK